jgi:hypothetical protein
MILRMSLSRTVPTLGSGAAKVRASPKTWATAAPLQASTPSDHEGEIPAQCEPSIRICGMSALELADRSACVTRQDKAAK